MREQHPPLDVLRLRWIGRLFNGRLLIDIAENHLGPEVRTFQKERYVLTFVEPDGKHNSEPHWCNLLDLNNKLRNWCNGL